MSNLIYTDKLVEITEREILFRHYYFPIGSKKIDITNIERVKILKPTLLNGKWRIHGSGDFHTWFSCDIK